MTALVKQEKATAIESALIGGDLAKLTTEERLYHYNSTCESLGLNPLTKPFDYITLNGKLTLYAKRDATDQLRRIYKVSVDVTERKQAGDIYIVTAKATMPDGRSDASTGAVVVSGLKGNDLANAYMKAETKAKRRVTLSICGLGILDETEIGDVGNDSGQSKASKLNARGRIKDDPPIKEADFTEVQAAQIEEQEPQEPAQTSVPFCCNKEMKLSKWADKESGKIPFWCPECKRKEFPVE